MSDSTNSEAAVRAYLNFLANPSSAVDTDAVSRAKARFAEVTDPIEKLHAASAVEKAKAGNATQIRSGFVAHAKAYADAEGLPVEAFQAMKVADDVLAEAGFTLPAGRSGAARATRKRTSPRAPYVSVESIKAAVSEMPKRFTLVQVAEKAGGGSPTTIRKAVQELIDANMVVSLGADPAYQGMGRAPTLYEQR